MDIVLLDTSGHLANPKGGPDTLRDPALDVAPVEVPAETAPQVDDGGVPAPPIYAPAARDEVKRIIQWLNDLGDKPRLFAWLPEVAAGQTDHFTDFICELTLGDRAFPVCIVEMRNVTPELFERMFVRGLRRIIVNDDPAIPVERGIKIVRAAKQHLEDMRRGGDGVVRPMLPADWYTVSLWAAGFDTPANYQRVRAYIASGIEWGMISHAEMELGASPEAAQAAEIPSWFPEGLTCKFYDNTIVIDSDLQVLPCPRYIKGQGTPAGMLYKYVPEALMVAKGRRALTIGCAELCASCGMAARFRWDQSRSAVIDEYVKLGRREGTLEASPITPAQLEGRHIDLAAADPDAQAAELAAFEQSLDAWAADLGELDDGAEQK